MNTEPTSYVAFLRGINVGGHRKVPMAELRALVSDIFEGSEPRTHIASGNLALNAMMDRATVSKKLTESILDHFGFDVPVVVRTQPELAALVSACPWPDQPGNLVYAYLCFDTPALDWIKIADLRAGEEEVVVNGETVWFHAKHGMGTSKLGAKLEACLGVAATARNLNTLVRCTTL